MPTPAHSSPSINSAVISTNSAWSRWSRAQTSRARAELVDVCRTSHHLGNRCHGTTVRTRSDSPCFLHGAGHPVSG